MKTNHLRVVLFSIMMLFCIVTTGCNNEQTETVYNENGAVTAISIKETGGEDGRDIDWNVYQEDDKYIFFYYDHKISVDQPKVIEITEQEYQDVMSLDYAGYIAEYDESYWEGVADAVYFQTTITYENGVEESTKAIMTYPTIKILELLRKYGS